MKVFICANFKKEKSISTVNDVIAKLLSMQFVPMIDKAFSDIIVSDNVVYDEFESLISSCDIILTVGGDGTIIKWGRYAAEYNKALLGINTGRLGFLTAIEHDELHKLDKLKENEYRISKRMLLSVSVKGSDSSYIAVNDVVFSKTRYAKLPEFCVNVSGNEVTKIRADGIIFSTPTGSTAYSLAAGGPIISPDAKCIEFTPLCAHSLFGRPMIFSSDSEISVNFSAYEGSGVVFNVDGDDDLEFRESDTVIIRKSELELSLIEINGGGFYNAVHNKLMKPLK